MSSLSKKSREKFKSFGDHQQFLQRITKTLYYGKLPSTERLSFPVTELAAELFSEARNGRSLERLHSCDAAKISRNACVSPCSLVLAILYLEQLKSYSPEYLQRITPSDLFLVSLMVSNKFLYDNGEEDEVFISEWASSGGISTKELIRLEKEFLSEIQWQVFVTEHNFWRKLGEIECTIARREGVSRGWFTYTELQNLSTTINIANLIQCIANILSVVTATYTLGFLTLLGSVFIASNIPGNYLHDKNVISEISSNSNINHTCNMSDSLCTALVNDIDESAVFQNNKTKQLDAADVLKTGILLASIKTRIYARRENNSTEIVESSNTSSPWAWWSNPAMNWLTETSASFLKLVQVPQFKYYTYRYRDEPILNIKMLNLEDQIHKATKVRIQDQLEQSWHVEWTDTLKNLFL